MLIDKTITCPVCDSKQSKEGGGIAGRWYEAPCDNCGTILDFDTEKISVKYLAPPVVTELVPPWEDGEYKKVAGKYHNLAASRETAYFFSMLLRHGLKQKPENIFMSREMYKELLEGEGSAQSLLTLVKLCFDDIRRLEGKLENANRRTALLEQQELLRKRWHS